MIIPFAELKKHNFSVSDVNVISRKPLYRQFDIESRSFCGFIYIINGECKCIFENGELSASSGTMIYLPLKSKHKIVVTSAEIEFYRIDFIVRICNELTQFSSSPYVLTDSVSPECTEAIHYLEKNCHFENDSIMKTEKICKIFSALQNPVISSRAKKLAPAVQYINEHLTEGFSCRDLAEMCYMSTSQFYKLFSEEYKMTPLEYRNKFLLRRAKVLLKSEDVSVSEVAYTLGFDNTSYFSRFFKKHLKISPKEYQNS